MKSLLSPVLTFVFVSSLAAQQQPAPVVARPPVIDIAQMTLDFVAPPAGAPSELLSSITEMYRREIFVKNADGSIVGPRLDVDDCGEGFILYDTADYVASIKAAVARAAAAVPQRAAAPPLRLASYTPRNVDVNRLAEALEPLRRKILVPLGPGQGSEVRQNLSFQANPAMLSIQDTQEQVQQMLALLAEVDQPAPQFLIQGLVLGTEGGESNEGELPPELVENLHRLLPVRSFSSLGTVLMRASVEPGVEQTLKGKLSTGEVFQVTLLPGGLDLANHRISLQRLLFDAEGQSFETSAVIGLDEYTVIGGAGSNPKLLVLRVSSLTAK